MFRLSMKTAPPVDDVVFVKSARQRIQRKPCRMPNGPLADVGTNRPEVLLGSASPVPPAPAEFGSDCAPSILSVRLALNTDPATKLATFGDTDFRSYHLDSATGPPATVPGQ